MKLAVCGPMIVHEAVPELVRLHVEMSAMVIRHPHLFRHAHLVRPHLLRPHLLRPHLLRPHVFRHIFRHICHSFIPLGYLVLAEAPVGARSRCCVAAISSVAGIHPQKHQPEPAPAPISAAKFVCIWCAPALSAWVALTTTTP